MKKSQRQIHTPETRRLQSRIGDLRRRQKELRDKYIELDIIISTIDAEIEKQMAIKDIDWQGHKESLKCGRRSHG